MPIKKIKSLLVAGILIFSMSGQVFATGELPIQGTAAIEYPNFGDFSKKDFSLQNGNITLTLFKDSNGYRASVKWLAENYKVVSVKMIYEDGTYSVRDIMLQGETGAGQDCYIAVQNGDCYSVLINDGVANNTLVRVEVTFENLTKGDVPVVPEEPDTPDVPDVPEEPDTPEEPDVPDTPDVPEVPEEPDTPEVPEEPNTPEENVNEPQTGDTSLIPVVAIATVSAVGLLALRKKDEEE